MLNPNFTIMDHEERYPFNEYSKERPKVIRINPGTKDLPALIISWQSEIVTRHGTVIKASRTVRFEGFKVIRTVEQFEALEPKAPLLLEWMKVLVNVSRVNSSFEGLRDLLRGDSGLNIDNVQYQLWERKWR